MGGGSTHEAANAVPQGATPDLAPVSGAERISSLDFIRGIAVMGILAANIVAFGQPFIAYMYPAAFLTEHGEVSDWLLVAQFVLIDSKMRGLFTLLFGAGLYLFMERTWARGGSRWLQVWRLVILLAFGLIHFFLIWMGDILIYYAIFGFVAVACLRWGARTQLLVGLIGYLIGAFAYLFFMSFPFAVAETPFGETAAFSETREALEQGRIKGVEDGVVETELVRSGDYLGVIEHRAIEHGADPAFNLIMFGAETLPLMLIGVALYRLGFFSGGFSSTRMRRWGWAGVLLGGAVFLAIGLFLKQVDFGYYAMLAAFMGWSPLPQLAMVLGLAALLVEYSPRWTGWFAERVRAAGRAAFTNYLGTSIVMLFVFQGWALGLFGQLGRPGLYLVTVLTWALMLAWSKPWLDRYRYGPLEWLWRCLTYRQWFALRR